MRKKYEYYKHLIQFFVLVKITLAMMDHKSYQTFQPIFKTFVMPAGLQKAIVAWEPKG